MADLRASVDQANGLIGGLGGYVAASDERNDGDSATASVTYRIPADQWDEALSALRGFGARVVAENTKSEDVTAQVIDLEARIANLQSTEAALQAIMARATMITDVLKVQAELTDVRSDIESMSAQRDQLADRAALGTLTVRFNVPVVEASAASRGWDLGREIDSAVAALVRVGQGLASLGIWLGIVVLPIVLPLALLAHVALRVRRRQLARQQAGGPVAPSV